MDNDAEFIRECCVCHKVNDRNSWRAKRSDEKDRRISHGYCPACLKGALSEVDVFFENMGVTLAS